ncbi:MAG: DUF4129 domain-containing protein [Verrucomicrobia bacterium]|nr:DUF4129 domain-containing protein [Verrucomicrobiota bacterium]
MKRRAPGDGPGPIELLEEAIVLLRLAPASAAAAYLAGAVPFLLGVLFFWADMSRGTMAWQRCSVAALGVTLLYLWKRTCHSRFGAILRATAAGVAPVRWTARDWLAAAGLHARRSTWSLLLLLPAFFVLVPFAWVYAYHQSLTAVSETPSRDAADAGARAANMARLWPYSNHYALLILTLLSLFVLVNLLIAVVMLPSLLKSFLGVESWFTRTTDWIFDTTFLAAVFALAHLCTDPLVKAFYALRCHRGDARRTGLDLLAELRRLAPGARAAAAAALLLAGLPATAPAAFERTAVPAPATAPVPPPSPTAIPAAELDAGLRRVLARPEFAWRLPREAVGEDEEPRTWLGRTLAAIGRGMEAAIRWLGRMVDRIGKAIGRWLRRGGNEETGSGGGGLGEELRVFGWILLGGIAAVVAVQAVRLWRARRRKPAAAKAPAVAADAPDLDDESLLATHLPEDDWLALAARMRETGDLRKALRAVFLATLACLARLEWIAVSRAKSNLEYRREVDRRARAATPAFDEDVRLFERSWYGPHPATPEAVETLGRNLEAIRGDRAN